MPSASLSSYPFTFTLILDDEEPMSIATAALSRLHRFYPLPVSPARFRCANPPSFFPLFSPDLKLLPMKVSADAPRRRIRAAATGYTIEGSARRKVPGQLTLDELLSVAEMLCVTPPIMCSICVIVSAALPGLSRRFQVSLGSNFFVLQYSLLVGAVVLGNLIRWRQWRRISRVNNDGMSVCLIGRIEKVEEDIRGSATIIRVLSKQLEKLGTRFRLTRKALKEPITETAALAQKNSEATRALAMQEEILEKELGEIQKVLLAMQDQQQKQLELILAIGKAGRLLDSKGSPSSSQSISESNTISENKEMELETQSGRHGG